jgi:hypothetical protein
VRIAANRGDGQESHSRKQRALWPVALVRERILSLFLSVWAQRFPSHHPLRATRDGCRTWAQAAGFLRRLVPSRWQSSSVHRVGNLGSFNCEHYRRCAHRHPPGSCCAVHVFVGRPTVPSAEF